MPVFMAVWVPLMRAGFRKPGSQPARSAPGIVSRGSDCGPPLLTARAPKPTRVPPSSSGRMRGCCLKRWNSSNGLNDGLR